jgi:hypothetical protein
MKILVYIFILIAAISLQAQETTQRSLSEALDSNGKIIPGIKGNFNAKGFDIKFGKNGEPLFTPNGSGEISKDSTGNSLPERLKDVRVVILAIVIDGDNLYIGGNFTQVGEIGANNIVKWNGTSWSALGIGLNGDVNALAVSGNDVYAGGCFTAAGGDSTNNIAKWNTTTNTWSALGSGVSGAEYFSGVYALTVSGNDVYAGGCFTAAGGNSTNNIAKWDTTTNTWSALGSGVSGAEHYSGVYALTVSGNDVYAGGCFTTAGGISANFIAKWNTSTNTWSALDSGVNNSVFALAVSGNDLYVGGGFTTAGGNSANNIAKWNTTTNSWSALGNSLNGDVEALAVSGNDVYVGGGFTTAGEISVNNVAKWNTSTNTWSALGSGVGGSVCAMAVSGTDAYIGGAFHEAGGNNAEGLVRWDGSQFISFAGLTNVALNSNLVPDLFSLKQNYPNPFNPSTTINFSVPKAGMYTLKVYNSIGQEVATLVQREYAPGNYSVNFSAKHLASGMYIYRLSGNNVNMVKKMMLIK